MSTQSISPRLYSFGICDYRSWLTAVAFTAGNIIFPQLAHLIPMGGLIFLPIYFFTLLGAYKFGTMVGVLTAMASPLVNSALFGMPAEAMVPIVMLKGVLLALFAGYASEHYGRPTFAILFAVVFGYQTIGCAVEWLLTGHFMPSVQDFRMGLPGMILQIAGCWFIVNFREIFPKGQD